MANTYVKIASVTVGSGGAASMDFTAIPATYTDLKIVGSLRSNSTSTNTGEYDVLCYRLNGTTTGYTSKTIYGDGATTASQSDTTGTSASAGGTWGRAQGTGVVNNLATASTFSSIEYYLPNYNSSSYKSISIDSVTERNATNAIAEMSAALWSNTAAITTVSFALLVGTSFMQYSTATLYGIKSS